MLKIRSSGEVRIESDVAIRLVAPRIDVLASGLLKAAGAIAEFSAATVKLNAGAVIAGGLVKCDTLQANAVIAASYTPGAGNLW